MQFEEEPNGSIIQDGGPWIIYCLLGAIALCAVGVFVPNGEVLFSLFLFGSLIFGAPALWLIKIVKKWRAKNVVFPAETRAELCEMLPKNEHWKLVDVRNWLRNEKQIELSDFEVKYWLRKLGEDVENKKIPKFSFPGFGRILLESPECDEPLVLLGIGWIICTGLVFFLLNTSELVAAVLAVPMAVVMLYLLVLILEVFVFVCEKIESWVD
jgi:hypothetical protein